MSMKIRLLAAAVFTASAVAGVSQPTFLFEPSSTSVSLGANVFFQSIAFGDGPITYQWFKNGFMLPGETGDFLFLRQATRADGGDYFLVASTVSGSTTGSVVTLSIDPAFTKITTGQLVTDPGSSRPAAWGDYDDDGFPDVFVPKGASDFNYLYHNNGDGTFTRVMSGAVVSDYANTRNAVWADYDNDGRLDLLVVNSGLGGGGGFGAPGTNSVLYRNNGDGTFSRASAGGLNEDTGAGTSAAWADFDRDGFLDLCIGINLGVNFLYHNNGDGTFARVNSGPIASDNFKVTMSLTWGDFNHDGAPDLLVANQPLGTFLPGGAVLYANKGDGTFARTTNAITAARGNSPSSVWVDYNNDGALDLFVVNTAGINSALYRNNGDGSFTAITAGEIVNEGAEGANSTSCAWGDYDNDGWIDAFVTNDGAFGNFLYHNNGDGSFTTIETGSPASDRANSFGSAWVDIDHDGFLDLFVSNVTGENFLYRNNGNGNAWINVRLRGDVSNRSGVGAKVQVLATIGGVPRWQYREITARDGSGSPNTLDAHFGLGDASVVDSLRIEWPSGLVQELPDVATNQFLTVQEPPSLRVVNAARFEGDAGERDLLFTVRLTGATNTTVTVDYYTVDLTALAGMDYVATNGTVTFGPNQTTQTFAVTILGDLLDETNETFLVVLTNSTVLPITAKQAVGTILDDDPLTMSISDASVTEGGAPTNAALFTVSLLKPVDYEVTVDFATASSASGAIATSGVDFLATNGTLHFSPGQTTQFVVVPIVDDALDELNETFTVILTNVTNAILVNSQAVGTILDDDPFPTLNVSNASIMEGDDGNRELVFNVTLSAPSSTLVTAQYATSNLTATTGLDFMFAGGTLTFAPGTTNRTVTVNVIGDTIVEPNETFLLNPFNPVRAILGPPGIGTILDDDFKVAGARMSDAGFALSFPTLAGRSYRVDWAGALASPTVWTPLAGFESILGNGALFPVTDPAARGVSQRFYRIVLLSP